MTRRDLQRLAESRVRDAELLLANRRYQGAYYFAGLAIECGLKAKIAGRTRRFEFHDFKAAQRSHIHDLEKLVKEAGLWPLFDAEYKANTQFAARWDVLRKWDVEIRYNWRVTRLDAVAIVAAVTDAPDGVLEWLRRHWNK